MRKKSNIAKLVLASTWFSTRNAPTNSEKVCGTCSFELERDEVPIEVKIERRSRKRAQNAPHTDWYSLRESNPQRPLRRGLLYPFNYGNVNVIIISYFQ